MTMTEAISPTKTYLKPQKKKKTLSELSYYLAQRQIEIPLKVILVILLGYFLHLPGFKHFIFISNQRKDGRYEKSLWDITFLFFYICVFTALRASIMDYILIPFSKYAGVSMKKQQRFAEQSWACMYYTFAFSFGIYVMYDSPWWFDSTYFWRNYPVTDYTKSFKYYYLIQFAFWLQQVFVLQIEEPRKDYKELVMHHINTLLLVSLSYGCNFTSVGNAVFICMDLPDALLALAKTLNYCRPGPLCNTAFAIMVCSWMYTRVYIYGRIIISTLTEPELYVPRFRLDPLNGEWFPHFVKYIIAGLMIGLYLLILFWTVMIFKVIIRIFTSPEAKDVRSDDEDESDPVSLDKIEGDHSTPKLTAKNIKTKDQ
ncbi:TLC domain-containing protein [Cokeromyces recurvatus]|uniref:TLC domain-containing protein n=1 Tax=Cokeromyces recurvatus TaxID=90255 RepID=UPI00221F0A83|nr:TLC domain-containing protein [Cokeromyces recurvatus]KAI7899813.1 TLC domain-containing protein [Cokeromyces recurvatus]